MASNNNDFPVKLINRSFDNDVCPSYYFKVGDDYFTLWIDHENPAEREDPEAKRYSLVPSINEGDEKYPEIYDDGSKPDLLHTDSLDEVQRFIESELLGK